MIIPLVYEVAFSYSGQMCTHLSGVPCNNTLIKWLILSTLWQFAAVFQLACSVFTCASFQTTSSVIFELGFFLRLYPWLDFAFISWQTHFPGTRSYIPWFQMFPTQSDFVSLAPPIYCLFIVKICPVNTCWWTGTTGHAWNLFLIFCQVIKIKICLPVL